MALDRKTIKKSKRKFGERGNEKKGQKEHTVIIPFTGKNIRVGGLAVEDGRKGE